METMHKDCMDAFGTADDCVMSPGQDVTVNPSVPSKKPTRVLLPSISLT